MERRVRPGEDRTGGTGPTKEGAMAYRAILGCFVLMSALAVAVVVLSSR